MKSFRNRQTALLLVFLLSGGATLPAQPSSPPTISYIPDQAFYPNATSRVIPFTVGDAESPAQQLTVTGRSANTNLIPDSGLAFSGNKSNRSLIITPAPNQTGVTTITVTVTDPQGGSASTSFEARVEMFTELSSRFLPVTRSAVAWGDYDGDGRLDIVLGGTAGTGIVTLVYHNEGNWSFRETTNVFAGVDLGRAAWGDYDRDGDLDLLLAGGTTDTNSYYVRITALYRNNGGGQFTRVTVPAPDVAEASLAWGDLDNDGDLDFLLMGLDSNLQYRTVVCRNLGGDAFELVPTPSLPGLYSGSAAWGDYDNDGDLDILLTGYSPATGWVAKIFRNDGPDGLVDSGAVLSGSGAVWEDFDNDGDLDVICGGNYFRNNGNSVFDNLASGLGGPVAPGDFDNDGDLDIFSGRTLYQNNGSGGFSVTLVFGPTNASASAWADMDNDGDLDLIVTGSDQFFAEYRTRIFRNNLTLPNTPPSTPAGLSVTLLPGNDVSLGWNAASDTQTSSKGLSYNLRVGTNSGGIQIMSPQSDLATGFRRIPQSGLAHTNRWRLVDLPKGTYYWSVQAIDTAFAGSPFSATASFTITNERPFISTVATQVTFPNLAVSNVSFTVGDVETPAASLVVTASSSNTNLLSNANIILGGSGSNRTVTLIPTGNRGGEAVVTLTVTDTGGLTKSYSFVLRVEAFTKLASMGPPDRPNTVAANYHSWVDYDLDGDLDVLLREVLLLRNDGNGVFTPVDAGFGDFFLSSAAWGDVNGDGYPDLFATGEVAGYWPYAVRLYRNNGDGTFTQSPMQFPPVRFGSVSVADINGDGSQDLFLVGPTNNIGGSDILKIYLNDGHGAFFEWDTDLPVFFLYAGSSQWGDVDNDGDLDLLVGDGRLFRNDGGGHFTDISSRVPSPPWGSFSVNWADLDNDGDLDILVAGMTNVICRNNGDGSFAYAASGITNIHYGTAIVFADYNNDGLVDVVLSPNGGSLFRNNGNLTFTLVQTNLPPGLWGDYDGDGDLDMLASGGLYRNNSAVANTPPSAPTGLIAAPRPGSSIALSWTRPTDQQTTNANGLHYNVRVGTSPGGIDVVSPLAHATNGLRRVVQRGNAGSTNRWVLWDLPRGTYYWSVQAIDPAFAGSPFAPDAIFNVTRPVITRITDQFIAPGFSIGPIAFQVFDGETAASNLVVTVSSSNTNLIPLANIVLAGSGTNRFVTLTPAPAQRGTNLVTLTVTDGNGFTDNTTFRVIVAPFISTGTLAVGAGAKLLWADYNNDGWMDFLAGSTLYRNLGNGCFTNDATGLPGSSGQAAWGDFDNDGWLDLAFSDSPNLFRNNGSNHFIAVAAGITAADVGTVSWGDYNGDGRQDLLIFGWWGYSCIYRNNGDGTFTNSQVSLQWGQVGCSAWGDLDNDGDEDAIVSGDNTGGGSRFTYIYRNNGNETFSLWATNLIGVRSCSIALGDYDADGDLDVLLAGESASGQVLRIYRNNGGVSFPDSGATLPITQAKSAVWGDYDNDGDLDILVAGIGGTTVLLNRGNNTFTDFQAALPDVSTGAAHWADVNNDGRLDVIAENLFQNVWPITNHPPQPPGGLASSSVSNRLCLSWNAASDAETGSNALTYNLRVGTTPGGAQIISPNADSATGKRRLVSIGNAGQSRHLLLSGLPDGVYYWSVQTVDAGYAGSHFAPEASVSFFRPIISGPSNVVVWPTAVPASVSFTVGDADSPAESLTLTAFSSNAALLPASNIVFGGSGSNRTATLYFTPALVDTSVVAIVVTDVFGLSATNSFRFESSYFTDVTPVFSGGNLFNAKWADFDNDNDLDLYLAGTIYRNEGTSTFTAVGTVVWGERKGVCWADYDRDGNLDLASVGGGGARIYRNDGNGMFTDINAPLQGVHWASAAWGDFDNDGRPDLLLTGSLESSSSTPFTALYRNAGNDQFVRMAGTGLPAVRNSSVAWGDFNNDGWLDVLMNGLGSGPLTWFAEIYRNNGDGTFSSLGAGFSGGADGAVDFGDYDNDGFLDVLVTGFAAGTYVLHVYHNNGNGTFTETSILQGIQYGDATWVDFDNDGWLDILVTGCTANYCDFSTTRIYWNNRDGTFSNLDVGLPNTAGHPAAWGDFDNDGDLDLFLGRLYRNNVFVSNSPPTAPVRLVADLLPDNNVRLRWDTSIDAQNTNAAGLSYAVRAGTTPRGLDYVSPQADAGNGYRRLPARGPASTNEFFLRDVPKGNYFWSVQAVDAGLAGSPFSVEANFAITNARPLISAISNQLTAPGRTTAPISFIILDLETPADELILSGYSTNTTLVPNGNIVFGGDGSNRTVTLTPSAGLSGTTTIIIAVMDQDGLMATSRFDLVVQMFTEVSVGLPSVTRSAASAWADYDNDGDLDIALAGSGLSYTMIYRNNNGVFSNQNFNLPNRTESDLAWLDYDNDGDLDLTQCGWSGGYSPTNFVFRNNFPTNTFTVRGLPGTTNIADGTMAWGDFDNDGDPDLYLSGDPNTYHTPDAYGALYRNNGGVFTNTGAALPSVVRGAAAWGDYDNDGDLDLLIAGQTGSVAANSITKLFRNDGNDVFTEIATPFPGITDCALAFGDIDNDGDLDIAMAGTATNSVPLARIYRNLGNGVFTNLNANLTRVTYPSVAWGDFDNDGFTDLAVSGTTNVSPYYTPAFVTTIVYRNYGGAGFTNIGGTLPGVMMQNTSWGDYDNDGDLDLLVGTRLVRNNWNIPNTPPSAPTNLSSLILPNNAVRLSWSPSSDGETTNSSGLSYNLRLGTTPGGAQIISPLSDPASGYRRVPQPGNAGQTNAWQVFNLTNGTYYWSVQAIDTAFAGSAFSVEQAFTLSRPVFSDITNRSALPNTMVAPINFTVSDAETTASNLVVSVSSSDTNLVPQAGLAILGADTNRVLTIAPATNRSGRATITLTAIDESGQVGSRSFLLTIERFADIAAGLTSAAGPVAWGDFDNDGHLDLVKGRTVYRNLDNSVFTNLGMDLPYNEGIGGWGDYNNDGNLDLLAVGAHATIVYRGDGRGGFSDSNAGLPPAIGTRQCAAWGDYDNDGDADILIAGAGFTRIYRNDGTNVFTDIGAGLPVVANGAAAWADYDKDGDLDILIAGNNLLRIYRNNGNGTFTDTGAGLPGLYSPSVAWGDFDNDGDLDFVVAGSTNNAFSGVVTRIYRNTTNLSPTLLFTNLYPVAAQGPVGVWKGTAAWGDCDNDGWLDLLVTGETTNGAAFTRLYRNNNGNFVDSGHALPGLRNSFAAWGDFDNDGHLDLALSGNLSTGTAVSRIYRNFPGGPPNVPPTPPGALTHVVIGKSVRLSWTAASDANQTRGLSYNLRVGTMPGTGDIVSPMADGQGLRGLPALGNANQQLAWTITNLTGGTFYWSVQAIDASFAGSAFAPEGSFVVSNRPPIAAACSLVLAEDSSVNITLTGSDPDGDPLTYRVVSGPLFGLLTGTPPNVTYKPLTNYFGFDQFTFAANDRTTDSVPAAVFLEITAVPDVTEVQLGIEPMGVGGMRLWLRGEPWHSYRIEASEDLAHWVPLAEVLATNLLVALMEADAAQFNQRFYRAAWLRLKPEFGPMLAKNQTGFSFTIVGEAGRNYRIQVSTNLVNWTTLGHVLLTNSPMLFIDPDAGQSSQRFYRIVGP